MDFPDFCGHSVMPGSTQLQMSRNCLGATCDVTGLGHSPGRKVVIRGISSPGCLVPRFVSDLLPVHVLAAPDLHNMDGPLLIVLRG